MGKKNDKSKHPKRKTVFITSLALAFTMLCSVGGIDRKAEAVRTDRPLEMPSVTSTPDLSPTAMPTPAVPTPSPSQSIVNTVEDIIYVVMVPPAEIQPQTTTVPANTTTSTVSAKENEKNSLAMNRSLQVSQADDYIRVKWGRVTGATGYWVYATYCGQDFPVAPVKIVSSNRRLDVKIKTLEGKKIDQKKNFKIYVAAVKSKGEKHTLLGKTITGHAVGRKNAKHTNIKGLKLEQQTLKLKKGEKKKIEATVSLVNPKKKMLSEAHAPTFRYASTDKKTASVNKNGMITGKKKGSCYVFVYAKNGYAKKAKITVS